MLKFLGRQLGMYTSEINEAIKKTQRIYFEDDKNIMGLG